MKVLNKGELCLSDKVDSVCQELEILELAIHPFLAKMHHSFQTDNQIVFVMDFAQGGDLFRSLRL